jgi:hypothetical protein
MVLSSFGLALIIFKKRPKTFLFRRYSYCDPIKCSKVYYVDGKVSGFLNVLDAPHNIRYFEYKKYRFLLDNDEFAVYMY